MRLGFLASHNGSNVQAIVDACRSGVVDAEPVVVISNNPGANVLKRAQRAGIKSCVLNGRTHPDPEELDRAIVDALVQEDVDLVILGGYMKKLGPRTLGEYPGRILNTHPALLPKFGGKGMYGARVHAAVLACGDTVTGATVHLVNEEYDEGPILAQAEVPVCPGDTVDTLGERVLAAEHELYVQTLKRIVDAGFTGPIRPERFRDRKGD